MPAVEYPPHAYFFLHSALRSSYFLESPFSFHFQSPRH